MNKPVITLIAEHFLFTEEATGEENTSIRWDLIENICDNITRDSLDDYWLQFILNRMHHDNKLVVLQALTVFFRLVF